MVSFIGFFYPFIMLSRLALLPRAGLTTATIARKAAVAPSISFARSVAPTTTSPWIRTYAKTKGSSSKPSKDAKKSPAQPKSSPKKDAAAPSSASSPAPETESAESAESTQSAESAPETQNIPFNKLPDLTQGIPSTWEHESSERSSGSDKAQPSYLQAIEESERGEREQRDRRDEYVSTNERNRQRMTRILLGMTAAGAVFGILYLGRNWEDEIEAARHPDVPNGWGPNLWYQRVKARWNDNISYYQDPAYDKLLPDPDPMFSRPYTLCLSLDDLLVHSEWTREHGWRVAKRPGMDYFLRYLSQYYELVLFTTVPFGMGEPLMRKLDPYHIIMWPLFREATKYEDGEIVKDLTYLNRDLSKVIIIDTKAKHVRKQPENAIVLDPWKGDSKDKELVGLIPFLEYIHTMGYSDVRKIIKSFDGKHIPTEFSRREAIARKEFNARMAKEKKTSKGSGVGALGSMLGMKSSNMSMTVQPEGEQNQVEAFSQGKMLQDIARERGQRNYEMLEKEIRENGEKWLKEEAAMMEKMQQEAMSSMMGSFGGWFGVKSPEQSEPPKKA